MSDTSFPLGAGLNVRNQDLPSLERKVSTGDNGKTIAELSLPEGISDKVDIEEAQRRLIPDTKPLSQPGDIKLTRSLGEKMAGADLRSTSPIFRFDEAIKFNPKLQKQLLRDTLIAELKKQDSGSGAALTVIVRDEFPPKHELAGQDRYLTFAAKLVDGEPMFTGISKHRLDPLLVDNPTRGSTFRSTISGQANPGLVAHAGDNKRVELIGPDDKDLSRGKAHLMSTDALETGEFNVSFGQFFDHLNAPKTVSVIGDANKTTTPLSVPEVSEGLHVLSVIKPEADSDLETHHAYQLDSGDFGEFSQLPRQRASNLAKPEAGASEES